MIFIQCIICEKPSAAKNYATALGGFSGTFNGKQYVIVNSVGHIFSLLNPEEQVPEPLVAQYKSWDIANLPWDPTHIAWKKKLNSGFEDTYKKIKDAVDKADEIVIATDDDPTGEGTLLADEILYSIRPKGKHFYRSFHTDESIKEIQRAMSHLTDLGMNPLTDPDYKKAEFRSKWDYLSMQWTRVFTKLGDGRSVLRQGRLKSYMVWVVAEQIKKAQGYEKIPFYENRFKDENGNVFSSKKEPKFEDKTKVPNIYHGSDVVIDSEDVKYSGPPALYDLNMLSAALAPFGFKATQVLETYQKMYEDHNSAGEGIVSYPRTEDKTITPEQFDAFVRIAPQIASVIGIDPKKLTHLKPRSTHVVAAGSHGANRPTGHVPPSLSALESRYGKCGRMIYELLARNSLAMLFEDYEYLHQSGHLKDYPDFKGTSNIPKKLGFKEIFNDDKKKGEDETGKELGKHAEPFVYEGFPPKPAWPTAKWLAKELEKNDVGTGATRTSIFADVTNAESKYPLMLENKGKITLTTYGEMSYILLKDTHIGDVKLTEGLQQHMRDVAAGADAQTFLNEVATMLKEDIETVKRNAGAQSFKTAASTAATESGAGLTCPLCGKPVRIGPNGAYCTGYKEGCKFGIYRTVASKKLTDKQITDLLTKKKTGKISGFTGKSGKTFDAILVLDGTGKINFDFSAPKGSRKPTAKPKKTLAGTTPKEFFKNLCSPEGS